MLLAGAALAQFGRLSLVKVILTAVTAAIVGDNIGFVIGRRGGRALAERHGWRVGLTRARIAQFDRFFERYGGRTGFIPRFVAGVRVVGAVLAGGSGLGWRTFLFYNAAGAIVWSTTIAVAGYSLAYSWATLERWVAGSGLVALAIVLVAGVVVHWRRRRMTHD